MLKRQLEYLDKTLDCAIHQAKNSEINYLEYDSVDFACLISNLESPCTIGDFLSVIKDFVNYELKMVIEEENNG